MPDLLHEYWANDDGGSFGPVRVDRDEQLPILVPNGRLVFSLRARSWYQAMRLHNERLGYGDFVPEPTLPDYLYSDAEAAEQDAYLSYRSGR
jgi:hypothetical protein